MTTRRTGKEGEIPPPDETLIVQWDVKAEDTDIASTTPSLMAVVGSLICIDDEMMIVTNVSNPDNLGVTRGSLGSTVEAHAAGATISIWAATEELHPLLHEEMAGVRATAQRQADSSTTQEKTMTTATETKDAKDSKGRSTKLSHVNDNLGPPVTLPTKRPPLLEDIRGNAELPQAYIQDGVQRGAGSGALAVATRGRNSNEGVDLETGEIIPAPTSQLLAESVPSPEPDAVDDLPGVVTEVIHERNQELEEIAQDELSANKEQNEHRAKVRDGKAPKKNNGDKS